MSELDLNPQRSDNFEYAGFLDRFWATLIDTLVLIIITLPLAMLIDGNQMTIKDSKQLLDPVDIMINWLFPAMAVVLFWHFKSATPGKMLIAMKVVDEKTGLAPSLFQSIIRYLAYFISILPLFLGFFWIVVDKKKQGWHDKIAGTVVVKLRK
ncbi:RDD family protein [Endozoicomonas sp. 8E]|uniref:RDD family protein n=1 Tax=Endozoicomonas sp. 8E TaxID=3035692 RepID=UPI0029392464|nr:RDD family protein [Endozoicomonas sp. 8E]WOG28179.1 RDD family protein [Endozoicomonas sp. 8E]